MRRGDSVLYIEFEDEKVKELFDDLNDVQGSKGLMKKTIGADRQSP